MMKRIKEFFVVAFMLLVSACIQAPPPKPTLVIQCPPIVNYSDDFQEGFSKDIFNLENSKVKYPYLEDFINDAESTRDSIRICQKHAQVLSDAQTGKKK